MRKPIIFTLLLIATICSRAESFNYRFTDEPLAEALSRIAEDHPSLNINFIYNELENYLTSARVQTDNPLDALRRLIGLNPVTVSMKDNSIFIEALQHGKYIYTGRVIDAAKNPLDNVTVMALTPKDSAVVTYGVTDALGRFAIPCDKKNIILKFSLIGYRTDYLKPASFELRDISLKDAPIQLHTVSVEAQSTSFSPDKTTFIPTTRQKNASRDAFDLLGRMAVPQLVVAPGSTTVKDVFGKTIPLYINYQEAAADQLQGMKMSDVKKIELIEYPDDPRFNGNEKVLNIIVAEYQYGGYTKLSLSESTLNGFKNSASVFSKFTYKKVTYDLFAGTDNSNYRHNGTDTKTTYTLGESGNTHKVMRTETMKDAHERQNGYPVTFRASYGNQNFATQNSVSFKHTSVPESRQAGTLDFNLNGDKAQEYLKSNPNHSNYVSYNGSFQSFFGNKGALTLTPSFSYIHRNVNSLYSPTPGSPIDYLIKEDAYSYGLGVTGLKALNNKNRLQLFARIFENTNDVSYLRSNLSKNRMDVLTATGHLMYSYSTKRTSLTVTAGVGYERNSLNRHIEHDVYPYGRLNFSVSPAANSRISAFMYYQTLTPSIDLRSGDVIQNNEVLYLSGNPNLKNERQLVSNLAYNWFLGNKLSTAVFGGYNVNFNRVATIFEPYGESALLRTFINNGDYKNGYVGASVNYKLLKNSLQLYANVSQNFYHTTGIYRTTCNPLRVQLQASYYWKNFNVVASWGNSQKKLTENSNIIIRSRSFHYLGIGWGNGQWYLNLSANNFLRRGWESEYWEQVTPRLTEYQTSYNSTAHARLNFSVTYTIGYGKELRRQNEINGANEDSPSAIIRK